jgi:Mediator complex subunit 23
MFSDATCTLLVDSTNSELFAPPMGILVEGIYGNNQKSISLPGNVQALTPVQPLSMNALDSMTVHAKMRFDVCTICFRNYYRFVFNGTIGSHSLWWLVLGQSCVRS